MFAFLGELEVDRATGGGGGVGVTGLRGKAGNCRGLL